MTLLDGAFVRELEALKRRLDIRARSGGAGEQLAKRRGGSAEFHEHRAYSFGDDLRRIDWSAYARTGEPVLKVFRAEEDVLVRLLVDASGSLSVPSSRGPSKLDVAKRLAAAVGYLALVRSERAQVLVGGAGLAREHLPARGRGGLPKLFAELEAIVGGGKTDLAASLDAVRARAPRPGGLVVVSDFLDPGAWRQALVRASAAGHDVALVHVMAPEEQEPPPEGDYELEDAETGELVEVSFDAAAAEAYVLRFAWLCEELRGFAKRHRATYVRVRTDEPLDEPVRRLVARSAEG